MMEAFVSTRQSHRQLLEPPLTAKKQHKDRRIASIESFSPGLTVGLARGLPYLADQGFNGERWHNHWAETYQVEVMTAPPANAQAAWTPADRQWLAPHRQSIETTFSRLGEVFGLKRLNAHRNWGKLTRLAAKMAAYNLGLLFNRGLQRADGALATLIC